VRCIVVPIADINLSKNQKSLIFGEKLKHGEERIMSEHKSTRIDSSEIFIGRRLYVDQRLDHGLCLVWQQAEHDEHSVSKIRDLIRKEVDANLFENW
jgi:hypothetical protein